MNKKILSLLMVLLCGFTFAACGKDETWIRPQHNTPLRPDNGKSETPHEDEDAPAKVQLTLAGGHFHGVAFHQDADAKGMLYKRRCSTSPMCAKATNGSWQKAATPCFA